ncbi:MAG: DNA mismatch repair protein MutS [Smithellaceae bacterium]|jgi:DNA mismatch repair protein MutS|nr:DNA mismatch repair protein MutS [Smithellaceae bacterium]
MAMNATFNLTPAMKQYVEIKEKYPDCILFYRMGDFYEMFFEDAQRAAPLLEITLTSRNKSSKDAVPLCGVPYHAASAYITRLVEKGYKVAVCEQVEDPKNAKGIVRREVVRVITPGLVLDEENLKAGENNYLACLTAGPDALGLAFLDLSTGEFYIGEFPGREALLAAAEPLAFRELLVAKTFPDPVLVKMLEARMPSVCVNTIDAAGFESGQADEVLERELAASVLETSALRKLPEAKIAAAEILRYVNATQQVRAGHISALREYAPRNYLMLNEAARRNLEIFATLQDGRSAGSLFSLINETLTPMGARRLRWWMGYPLASPERIRGRLAAVAEIKDSRAVREELRKILSGVYDLERLAGRVALMAATPRDLVALKTSLAVLPGLRSGLEEFTAPDLITLRKDMTDMSATVHLLSRAIVADPPARAQDGGFIAAGYDEELDRLRSISADGKKWIAALEARERQATGIHSLKIGYNSVFGYYIEVTKANAELVPDSYVRKQTLVNAERYINQELKEFEQTVLHAEEKIRERENELFGALRENLLPDIPEIQYNAFCVAELDATCALAEAAEKYSYVCPEIDDGDVIDIQDGRHPVVEAALKKEGFVPNDALLDLSQNRLLVITGPNMAGKSTYIRQVALIVLLAQMGSFVPASRARIGVVDKIFTRIGASDSLVKGQSTFMVEMMETAQILTEATPRSLVILDEVGRGTSTFDGLSIAWAVAEYIHDYAGQGMRTLFATHYHQLTDLAASRQGAKNYNIAVKEWGEKIIFLRRIMEGGTSRSYGIEVARIAGVPADVIARAREILQNLEKGEFDEIGMPRIARGQNVRKPANPQLSLFAQSEDVVLEELRRLDVSSMTPLDALNKLNELKSKL